MMDGHPNRLPENWSVATIGNVTVKTRQRDPRKTPADEFQYVDVSSVSNESFKITSTKHTVGLNAPSRARKEINTDDVLFATVRPTLQRIAMVPKEFDGEIASTGYCVLRSDQNKIHPRFLYLFLLTDHFNTRMAGLERGASYPAVRDSDVKNSWIPLPPLSEQKKIAHFLSTVQRAIEAQELIIQTTTELLKSTLCQLMTGQRKSIIPSQEKSGTDFTKNALDGGGMSMVREIDFTQIAAGWDSITLGDKDPQALFIMRNGLAAKQAKDSGKYKVCRIETIRNGWIDDKRVGFVSGLEEKKVKKYLLQKGDILFSHINSDRHLGKTGFADRDYDNLLHGMNLLLIRANPEVFDPEFLNRVFQYYRDIGVFMAICSRAVNQSSINQAKMKALELPLPPLPEQREIVHILSIIQQKANNAQSKKRKLQDLFHALLHELMTAQIRVNEIELGKEPVA